MMVRAPAYVNGERVLVDVHAGYSGLSARGKVDDDPALRRGGPVDLGQFVPNPQTDRTEEMRTGDADCS
jgi:hypothetical protein